MAEYQKELDKILKLAAQGQVNCTLEEISEENRGKALEELKEMAEKYNDANAQYILALSYGGGQGVPENEKQAVRYTVLAAHQNHKGAKAQISILKTAARVNGTEANLNQMLDSYTSEANKERIIPTRPKP